jgi:glycosyltransferase involved in cell wall biosynthesis
VIVRVLVVSSTFPSAVQPTRGVFVRERVRRLAARCDVVVIAPIPWFPFNSWIRRDRAAAPRVEQQDGLTVYHPRFFSLPRYGKFLDGAFYFLSLVPFVTRLRRRFPFEVIDAHFAYPDGVAATLLARLFRRPVVVTLRGSIVRLSGYRLHRPQLRWVLRQADRVTAVSESLSRVAADLGRPRERVRVIPNGVDTTNFRPMSRLEARRLVGLPEQGPILLTVAGIYEGKGQHRVIEALPALLRRHPGLLYVMVGGARPGEQYGRRLEETAARLGVQQHVRHAGSHPHRELARWFNAADLSVLATRSEGWPNVLLESLACGTPVVASRVGGTSEIVRHGEDGLLVRPGDDEALVGAILEALDRPWSRSALADRARTFDWTDAVEQALDEINRAVKGSV